MYERRRGWRRHWTKILLGSVFLLALMTLMADLRYENRHSGESGGRGCVVTPRFLIPEDYDAREVKVEVPEHVREFDRKRLYLPKYGSSELLLISVSSNNTFERQIAQNYTFGRIFDLHFVTDSDFPRCVLCAESDVDEACHCPEFRMPCGQHIFHKRSLGWWCATRKALAALEIVLNRWEAELPKWVHLLDDNTWINPISEKLIIENLDPDGFHFIGDDWGDFLAGGPGFLMSRGVVRRLLGPPVYPDVMYRWPNGTHSITAKTQIESCLARMQGGDWCYFHGDWALTLCVREAGIYLTDVGSKTHGAFFTQVDEPYVENTTWFDVGASIAPLLHHTHSAALHVEPDEMYDIFYNRIVPYYQNLYAAFQTSVRTSPARN